MNCPILSCYCIIVLLRPVLSREAVRISTAMFQVLEPHLPLKKGLDSTPPPPKKPGEVQYLSLDLDKNGSESEKSPASPRSPPQHLVGHSSPTDYKEIDFVKTKALGDMKKDLENRRKSSEKSIDE